MKKVLSVLLSLIIILSLVPEVFAAEFKMGDTNGDGMCDAKDALDVLLSVVGQTDQINRFNVFLADTNFDGKINSLDALNILEISVQKEKATMSPEISKDVIVDWYNSCLEEVYGRDEIKLEFSYNESGLIVNKNNKNEKEPYESKYEDTVTFKKADGSTYDEIAASHPGKIPNAACIEKASVEKITDAASKNSYKITVLLKEEQTDIFDSPEINKETAFGFNFNSSEDYDIQEGTTVYSGTKLVLVFDENGKAVSIEVEMPYCSEYDVIIDGAPYSLKDEGADKYSATFE